MPRGKPVFVPPTKVSQDEKFYQIARLCRALRSALTLHLAAVDMEVNRSSELKLTFTIDLIQDRNGQASSQRLVANDLGIFPGAHHLE